MNCVELRDSEFASTVSKSAKILKDILSLPATVRFEAEPGDSWRHLCSNFIPVLCLIRPLYSVDIPSYKIVFRGTE